MEQVSSAAKQALLFLCACCSNTDIEPFIPGLMKAIEFPEQSSEMVHKLASTVFVQKVDGSSLSVISPVLVRGFVERVTAIRRACARIVENMAKLVEDPRDVALFLPKLLPLLESAKDSVADPECREACTKRPNPELPTLFDRVTRLQHVRPRAHTSSTLTSSSFRSTRATCRTSSACTPRPRPTSSW